MMRGERKKAKLIAVSGVDGSGKTTLCHGINEYLRTTGTASTIVYGRYQPRLLRIVFLLWGFMFRTDNQPSPYMGYLMRRNMLLSWPPAYLAYRSALVCDYCLGTLPALRRASRKAGIVICDRYIYDTVAIDLALSRSHDLRSFENDLRTLEGVFPRPDLAIMLTVTKGAAVERKNDIPDISYTEETQSAYAGISSLRRFRVIDGNRDKGTVLADAVEEVIRMLGWRT